MSPILTEIMYEPRAVVACLPGSVSVTVPYDPALSDDANHVLAAQRLLADYGLDGDGGGYDWSMGTVAPLCRVFIRGTVVPGFTQPPRRGRRKADRTASDAPAGAV